MKERISCTKEQIKYCPLKQHFQNWHHLYWPRNRYVTPLEQEFRELPENKVSMCTNEHNELHRTEFPPKKPGVAFMLEAVMKIEE